MVLPRFQMRPSLRCYGERALSGLSRTQWFVAAHWCSHLVCLDVFFALGSLFPPVFFLFCLWPPGPLFFLSSLSFSVFNVFSVCLPFLQLHSNPIWAAPIFLSLPLNLVPIHQTHAYLLFIFFTCCSPALLISVFFPFAVSDGSLYSAMSSVDSHAGSIRRTFGSQKLLKTENIWLLSE